MLHLLTRDVMRNAASLVEMWRLLLETHILMEIFSIFSLGPYGGTSLVEIRHLSHGDTVSPDEIF